MYSHIVNYFNLLAVYHFTLFNSDFVSGDKIKFAWETPWPYPELTGGNSELSMIAVYRRLFRALSILINNYRGKLIINYLILCPKRFNIVSKI